MKSALKATLVGLFLSYPALAHAQLQSDDWLLSHPYEQPERIAHGDWEVIEVDEWERSVFEANEYRYRKQAEEAARRAALPRTNSTLSASRGK
jgi:hypothetical protein